jgi:hypothetical protein
MPDIHISPKLTSALWTGLVVAVLLLGFGLRVHRLAYDSVWWDEGFSVWMARLPIRQMLAETARDTHPPLSYATLHFWLKLAGDEELALRLPSAFFGLLTVAVTHQIGREAGGRKAGLTAALLTALARLPVSWSQEIRMYAPASFFATLALWAALRVFSNRGRTQIWAVLLTLSLAAGLLELYLFAAVVLVLNLGFMIAFLASTHRWRLAAVWLATQVGALALFAPWIVYAWGRMSNFDIQATVGLWYVVKLYLSTVFLGIATDIERYLPLLMAGLIVLIGTSAIAAIAGKGRRVIWAVLVIGTLLPPFLVYTLSLPSLQINIHPPPSPRYFLLLCITVYVLIGWGITALDKSLRIVGIALLAGLVSLSGWSLRDYYTNSLYLSDDYISLAQTLEALRQPDDVVILNNDKDWPIFAYHYPYPFERSISYTQPIRDEKYADYLLAPYRENYQGIWLVQTRYAPVTDPQNYLLQWLQYRAWNWRHYRFAEADLWFFAMQQRRGDFDFIDRAETWPRGFIPVDAPIAEGAQLRGYTHPLPEVQAGNLITLGLGWHVTEGHEEQWPVALELIGQNGEEITSAPLTLYGSPLEREFFLPTEVFIPPNAPTGQARLVFVAGTTWQPLGTLRIRPPATQPLEETNIPPSAQQVGVRFGDNINLLAVSIPDRTEWLPGESIPLTLYWQASHIIPERYKVFVHLVGEAYNPVNNNTVWGQQDQEPRGGLAMTTSWLPGEIIVDDYLVPISPDAPPGHYRLQVGLYLPFEGNRLPAVNTQGQLLGDSVVIFEIEILE